MADEHSGETKPKVESGFQLVVKDQTGGEGGVSFSNFLMRHSRGAVTAFTLPHRSGG